MVAPGVRGVAAVSLKGRLERLEGQRGPERCPECGGAIVWIEHDEDGTERYPFGPPCSECHGRPSDGGVGFIEVVLAEATEER